MESRLLLQVRGGYFPYIHNLQEIVRFRPRSFRASSRPTYSDQVRPASADASAEDVCMEAFVDLPQEHL